MQFDAHNDLKTSGHARDQGYYGQLIGPGKLISESVDQLQTKQTTRVVNEAEKIFEEAAAQAAASIVEAETLKGRLEVENVQREEEAKRAKLAKQCEEFADEDVRWPLGASERAVVRANRRYEADIAEIKYQGWLAQQKLDEAQHQADAAAKQAMTTAQAISAFADLLYSALFDTNAAPDTVMCEQRMTEMKNMGITITDIELFAQCQANSHQKKALESYIKWANQTGGDHLAQYIGVNSKWVAKAAKKSMKEAESIAKEEARIAKAKKQAEEDAKEAWREAHPAGRRGRDSSSSDGGSSSVSGGGGTTNPNWDGGPR